MHVALLVSLRRRHRAALSSGGVPSVALQKVGGAWFVVTNNTDQPDGYFKQSGGALVIDDAASSGLPISVSGPLLVGT